MEMMMNYMFTAAARKGNRQKNIVYEDLIVRAVISMLLHGYN